MLRPSALALLLAGCAVTPPPAPPPRPPAPAALPEAKPLALDRPTAGGGASPAPVLLAMQEEARRSMAQLGKGGAAPPYFLGYEVMERQGSGVTASLGALLTSSDDRRRSADVDLRVGEPRLDNTHPMRDAMFDWFGGTEAIPLDDDPVAIRVVLWRQTEARYRAGLERLVRVRSSRAIKVKDEDDSGDLSTEAPATYLEAPAKLVVDRAAWERKAKDYSALFKGRPELLESSVSFEAQAETRYLATSEGTALQLASSHARLTVTAHAMADDGMMLDRFESFDARTPEALPDDATLRATIQRVGDELVAMRAAPLAEPFVGPAILEGRAAGVFFHETFGHRVEGHRQKGEDEGQTFTRKVGERIMPELMNVYDDPTAAFAGGVFLNGHYRYDDQGVPAQRASLVEAGVLRGFLMSRSPIRGFPASNGHGRRQEGHPVVARQGNLIVAPKTAVPVAELTRMLVEEVRRQGKPYGLRFREVSGGFTGTSRGGPQAFKVLPIVVFRVYPDGREELVRGADIEGTPLTALSTILAAGDDPAVFDGYCGAESGYVPVSAVSPSLLLGQLEIARRAKGNERPPILPPPAAVPAGGAP